MRVPVRYRGRTRTARSQASGVFGGRIRRETTDATKRVDRPPGKRPSRGIWPVRRPTHGI